MKKIILIISILVATIAIVWSCSKEETNNQAANKVELTPYEMQVNQRIKDFKQKIALYKENPGYKSGEVVSAEDALWLLEATINFSHTFPNEYYDEMQSEDLNLVVPKNANGGVDMDDLTQKYTEMKQAITDVYYNSTYEDKGLVLVDISEVSQSAGEITLNVETVTGEKGNEPPPDPGINGPFEEGDDWWYGENVGYCYEPYTVNDDAANRLYQEALGLIPDPSGNYYFINEFSFSIFGGEPDLLRDTSPDNYLDYWLYYSIEGSSIPFDEDEVLCLEYTEMNAYYTYLNGLMFDYLPNTYLPNKYNLNGYSVESLTLLEDEKLVNGIEETTKYFHKASFVYGLKIFYGEGDGPSEL
ncbi:MAG: hypothetical protein K9G76_10070 [Bacteroidales bacterium]|nr:hypothetical protein [Bacteroidales bacterium]MCF8404046.1 hypothetical protein [Bacteroidales bacterium]